MPKRSRWEVAANVTAGEDSPQSSPAKPEDPAKKARTDTGKSTGSRRPMVITRLLLWLIFGVVIGLLPLFADGIKETLSAGGFSFSHTLSQGELFVVSAVIAAGAIGELFVANLPKRESNYKIAGGGFCFLLCMGNAFAYAYSTISVACAVAEENTNNASSSAHTLAAATAQGAACAGSAVFAHQGAVVGLSISFFVPTVLLSATCIGMAAGR